jgi:FtsZ-interacting cell division protein ZipA
MKLLLVVGLAAVVIVILIAVFLSVRLGRGDDHEEPVRPGTRDRGHRDDEDSRWQDADAHDSRRVMASSRTGASSRDRDEADTSASHYRGHSERRPSRDQAARGRDRDYDYPDPRDTGPSEHPSSPRRPMARNGRPASGPDGKSIDG